MEQVYITNVEIKKVRHLQNISIPLSENEIKHLIFTGKNVLPLLTAIFPNIQFIITSHSPFILNSVKNAVIYDLENHILAENGLNNIPYDGIVEGYQRVPATAAICGLGLKVCLE